MLGRLILPRIRATQGARHVNRETNALAQLMAVIENRQRHPSPNSYTTKLLEGGLERMGAKVMEEASEAVEAAGEAGEEGRAHLIHEAADLVYHLLVMLASRQVTWRDVELELESRFGISGLEEKASRRPESE
jgi:phosphoribosyl-ATP pyrophosphohydrolase